MLLADFDYALPDELIARFPAAERSASRLLEVGPALRDRQFKELPSMLREGDLLVFNDTQVIKARLAAIKETGGRAEILIERVTSERQALAHIRASKSPKPGSRLTVGDDVDVVVTDRDGEFFELQFSEDVLAVLDACGEVPLPPYLQRRADASDIERYQTVYANDPGAVAAPTAGLHFDQALLDATRAAGAEHAWVTLHVGAGTFQNLRESNLREQRLHSERVIVSDACCEQVRKTRAIGGRIIAVGTTAVRSLECASNNGELRAFSGETDLFITPGYTFQNVDAMITNFHLPKSSLLMLVAAFSGRQRILDAYRHAVGEKYRFFSYGDAMFLSPDPAA